MFHSWADNLCNHCVYICTTLASQLASTTFTKSNKENHFISKRLKVPPHTFFVLACCIKESGQKRNQTWFLFNLTPSKELQKRHDTYKGLPIQRPKESMQDDFLCIRLDVWIFSMKNQLSTECICTIPGQSMFGITHILLETFLLFMIWQWCSSSTFYKLDYILGLLGCAFAVARCKINRLQGSTGGETHSS